VERRIVIPVYDSGMTRLPPMSKQPFPKELASRRSLISRLIDAFNPGVTLLVSVWVVGLTARRYLIERDRLEGIADQALTSLAFVVPLMLVGWAVLAIADRRWNLGIFPRSDDE
jgi:hypothetical protein